MSNLGTVPNNGSPNYNTGLWPMPDSAPSSEADGPGIMPSLASVSEDQAPPAGGNDGDIADTKVVG